MVCLSHQEAQQRLEGVTREGNRDYPRSSLNRLPKVKDQTLDATPRASFFLQTNKWPGTKMESETRRQEGKAG